METICNFSFIDWIDTVYPCEDDTTAKITVYNLFSDNLQNSLGWNLTKDVFKTNLDMFSILCKSNPSDVDLEAISKLCEVMDKLKENYVQSQKEDDHILIYSGYDLNLSALPVAILFWKHLLHSGSIPKTRRTTRANFENEYKLYVGRNPQQIRFSHILFCLSWLNVLRVVNNSTVFFNSRCNLVFE